MDSDEHEHDDDDDNGDGYFVVPSSPHPGASSTSLGPSGQCEASGIIVRVLVQVSEF